MVGPKSYSLAVAYLFDDLLSRWLCPLQQYELQPANLHSAISVNASSMTESSPESSESGMAEQYSELELAPNDPAAQAPEVLDLSHQSPELDQEKKTSPPPVRDSSSTASSLSLLLTVQQLSPFTDNGGLTPSRPDFKSKNSHNTPLSQAPTSPRSENETLKETYKPGESGIEEQKKPEAEGRPRRRRPLFWIIVGLAIVLVLAIALGVGLGVGLTRNNGSHSG